ncbi:unnamed protein product [Rodentolepis nana]|uniref:RH1 domain-containing protein n=1 Tax=Rodentolepis nana TaxID=102285 RepID=A0A0R3T6Q8_RODNA|nr:unnamed protein product [Rodentolepis nana]
MLASSEWKSGFPCDASAEAAAAAEGLLEGESTSQTWDCEATARNETDFVSVAEVYEMAAAIGKDFEALIDSHGGDSICGLMPKVIHVLEELEEQASKRDGQLSEIAALQAAIERLEADKIARAQQRLKDEQVLKFPFLALILVFSYCVNSLPHWDIYKPIGNHICHSNISFLLKEGS